MATIGESAILAAFGYFPESPYYFTRRRDRRSKIPYA
ncbi:MAG: hypothetical protein ACI88G_000762, partial [Woeseiaceae bacterium]